VSVDIGTAADVVAQVLTVLALWLSLRSEIRQERIRIRAVAELVEALHASGDVAGHIYGCQLRASVTGALEDQGEHG
jgi:hypothetical protein